MGAAPGNPAISAASLVNAGGPPAFLSFEKAAGTAALSRHALATTPCLKAATRVAHLTWSTPRTRTGALRRFGDGVQLLSDLWVNIIGVQECGQFVVVVLSKQARDRAYREYLGP